MKDRHILIICVLSMLVACQPSPPILFNKIDSSHSGISFSNTITESDTLNLLDNTNMYNGAGVGIGDLNNDGLVDVFLAGNMVESRLYLNQGGLHFKDLTKEAGILTTHWVTGVSILDLNGDGLNDIYLSCSVVRSGAGRTNLLYVNDGIEDGIPTFTEVADEAGLADSSLTTHTVFFDYDLDGDLDAYCLTNATEGFFHNTLRPKKIDGSGKSNDKLYRNEGVDQNGVPQFTNVTRAAGILTEGYGLGIAVRDFNQDGWLDIYAANDFITNDLLWINQQDGTFKNQITDYVSHQSYNAMGMDIADITNNGLEDILVLDMLPEDNESLKKMMTSGDFDKYQMSTERLGYQPQFVRNTLQLNMGNGNYSEVGQMAGIHDTHWSWAPLIIDLDNDGLKDVFITNGFPKNVIDLDYINDLESSEVFGTKEAIYEKQKERLGEVEEIKLPNYVYHNKGGVKFEKVTQKWGFHQPSVSNGAAYGDLDNDGDLDLVINNINDEIFLYENLSNENQQTHYLQIRLEGSKNNLNAIGAVISIWAGETSQIHTHVPFRGFQSSMEHLVHFGLGPQIKVDSLKIVWPDGSTDMRKDISANQRIKLTYQQNTPAVSLEDSDARLLRLTAESDTPLFFHKEQDYYRDFRYSPLLPHQGSHEGPGIAVADVNGDGLADFYIGGSTGSSGGLFLQTSSGNFEQATLALPPQIEEMGVLFLDVDGDEDQDLYVVGGGTEYPDGSEWYKDRILLNDGKGNFTYAPDALPSLPTSGSCVVATDFDRDGDLDLFIGGGTDISAYPKPLNSYLLRNEKGTFTDVTQELLVGNEALGLVKSAIWTDVDNDQWLDLLVVGEWMPITLFHNENGKLSLKEVDAFQQTAGWWNSLISLDIDKDGDMDYVAGNHGLNNPYHVSEKTPLHIFTKDYDKNKTDDPIMAYYIGQDLHIAHPRDAINKQIVGMKRRFLTYKSYSEAEFEDILLPVERKEAYVKKAYTFTSSLLLNEGDGNFSIQALPFECQFSPINGLVAEDINLDGWMDVIAHGNDYTTNVSIGRNDAHKGLVLLGKEKGEFDLITSGVSGFHVEGDTRALVQLIANNKLTFLLGRNNDTLRKFISGESTKECQVFTPEPMDVSAEVQYQDGSIRYHEFSYGSGYLSQSSRALLISPIIQQVIITNSQGVQRSIIPES
ncbi:MAG: VCBS repeat-containing protein [Bacteroidota bacterium]